MTDPAIPAGDDAATNGSTGHQTLPYGSWPSPIQPDDLVSNAVRLGEPWIDGDGAYWLEGRPTEGGRRTLVRRSSDGSTVELTAAPFDVRTMLHEYGGGS